MNRGGKTRGSTAGKGQVIDALPSQHARFTRETLPANSVIPRSGVVYMYTRPEAAPNSRYYSNRFQNRGIGFMMKNVPDRQTVDSRLGIARSRRGYFRDKQQEQMKYYVLQKDGSSAYYADSAEHQREYYNRHDPAVLAVGEKVHVVPQDEPDYSKEQIPEFTAHGQGHVGRGASEYIGVVPRGEPDSSQIFSPFDHPKHQSEIYHGAAAKVHQVKQAGSRLFDVVGGFFHPPFFSTLAVEDGVGKFTKAKRFAGRRFTIADGINYVPQPEEDESDTPAAGPIYVKSTGYQPAPNFVYEQDYTPPPVPSSKKKRMSVRYSETPEPPVYLMEAPPPDSADTSDQDDAKKSTKKKKKRRKE